MEYLFNDVLEIKNGRNQKVVENPKGHYPIYGSGGQMGRADGKEETITEESIRFVKVNDDFSDDVIGTWEGRCTSEDSVFDVGQDHRWNFKDDGTCVYYVKDGDNWVPADSAEGDYFVAGNLLCGRWFEDETENRERWDITVDGDKMNWTALREGEDGETYTASFEMKRVQE